MADSDADATPDTTTRRAVLQGALVAGVAVPLLSACSSGNQSSSLASGGGGGGSAGTVVATTTAIPEGSGKIFSSDGVVVTQPKPGEFKGFTNICTHLGCPLHDVTSTINCICHGSQFSITDGSVVTGPATQALAAKQLKVSGKQISLA
jgi:nitrite reductase/ring-hydroxylating ferredoxin subunit